MTEVVQKAADEKFCMDCGVIIKAKAEICPKCGVRQFDPPGSQQATNQTIPSSPNGKSKLAAVLFALFLGGFGMHKFYLGSVGWGIIYLLFCWTFIPAFIALVEGILLLTMSEADFCRKYGNT